MKSRLVFWSKFLGVMVMEETVLIGVMVMEETVLIGEKYWLSASLDVVGQTLSVCSD